MTNFEQWLGVKLESSEEASRQIAAIVHMAHTQGSFTCLECPASIQKGDCQVCSQPTKVNCLKAFIAWAAVEAPKKDCARFQPASVSDEAALDSPEEQEEIVRRRVLGRPGKKYEYPLIIRHRRSINEMSA